MVGKVSGLDHEILDDPMEDYTLVVQVLASRLAEAFLPRTQRPEVLRRLGSSVHVQFEDDSTHWQYSNLNIEETPGPGGSFVGYRHGWSYAQGLFDAMATGLEEKSGGFSFLEFSQPLGKRSMR